MAPEENQPCLAWQLPQARPLEFSQAIRDLSPQMGVEEPLPLGVGKPPSLGVRLLPLGMDRPLPLAKEDSSEFSSSVVPVSSRSSHASPSQLTGSHSFPVSALTLKVDTL